MPRAVALVVLRVVANRVRDRLPQPASIGVVRLRDPEGKRPHSDQVVRRQGRRQGELASLGRPDHLEHLIGDERLDDDRTPPWCAARQQPSDDRRRPYHLLGRFRQTRPHRDLQPANRLLGQVCLGACHQLDHRLVRFPRGVAPGDDPVKHPDHSAAVGPRVERVGGGARQFQARCHVVEQQHVAAQRFVDELPAAGLIREGQDRVGMRVIDEPLGDERVHERFERRRGAPVVEEVGPELVEHRLV